MRQAKRKNDKLDIFLHRKEKDDSIIQKEIYLGGRKRRLPAWVMPLFLSLLVLLLILWLLPRIFTTPTTEVKPEEADLVNAEVPLEVGDVAIAKWGEVPLYLEPNRQSIRISSALFAERMTVQAMGEDGFVKVKLEDGFQAWTRRDMISSDLSVLEENGLRSKLLVLNSYKRVMSHTMGGYPIIQAPMGTILYADYMSSDIYRVRLPNGVFGWVNSNGIKELSQDLFVKDGSRASLFASSAMNFHRSPSLPGGMSKDGADMAGVIFISARTNGLSVPRSLQEQSKVGEEVDFIKDVETGLIRPSLLQTGDILFFRSEDDPKQISHAAIILEEGQALTAVVNDSVLSIRNLQNEEELLARLMVVRRYFP